MKADYYRYLAEFNWSRAQGSRREYTLCWTCYVLYKEYQFVTNKRLRFLASTSRRPDQFTVVYNVNQLAKLVENKKSFHNWLTYYETRYERNRKQRPRTKAGFWGLWGKSVDAIAYYRAEIQMISEESDEGLYAWVVANYALGSLGGEPAQTTGIIELGGASAQVTFVSNEPMPHEFSQKVEFGNVTYNLYSHS